MSNYCSDIVWKRDLGSDKRKLICARLADHADDEGRGIWPSVERVAAQCNVSERTVQRVLSDLVGEGLLIVIDEGGSGPGSTRRYDFDMARLEALPLVEWGVKKAKNKGVTVTPLAETKGDSLTEKGDSLSQKGCHRDTQTPIEPSEEPSERARARAAREGDFAEGREGEEAGDGQSADENPDRAAFQKRYIRFCNGRGFLAGPWPDWDESSPGWIGRQFAALTPDERAEAERWRDAYLLDFRDRKGSPMKVGIFLRDKAWTALDPVLLERFDKWRQAKLPPEERPKPDGWAAMLGPVGMARLFAMLLDGPPDVAVSPGALWFEAELRRDWPAVHQWKQMLALHGGTQFAPRWHALKDALEPVPQGTDMLARWKAAFAARGWPWLSAFDGAQVVFCPKGGPEGLEAFARGLAGEANEAASEAAE